MYEWIVKKQLRQIEHKVLCWCVSNIYTAELSVLLLDRNPAWFRCNWGEHYIDSGFSYSADYISMKT